MRGTFDSQVVKVILGLFSGSMIFDNHISRKWLIVEHKAVEFGTQVSYTQVLHICCTLMFDLVVFKVILGSYGALVSKCPVTNKWLVV